MKSHVHRITDALDTEDLCNRLGVKPRMIRKVRQDRIFPARWWVAVSAMCREQGVECPEEAFNWQMPPDTPPDPSPAE